MWQRWKQEAKGQAIWEVEWLQRQGETEMQRRELVAACKMARRPPNQWRRRRRARAQGRVAAPELQASPLL